jgi:hypothetical protein
MAGLLVITWLRFFGWLAVGLVFFFSWGRFWSEFADPYFRGLLQEESQKREALNPDQLKNYKSAHKIHGLAWTLCALLGFTGAHYYYLGKVKPALARTALFVIIVVLALVVPFGSARWLAYLWFLALLLPYELFWIVRSTQERNVALVNQIPAVRPAASTQK